MHGIDISSWQADINLANVNIDFAIVKATEGTSYVNPSCDKHVQQAIKKNLPWGFYHFAGGLNAKQEADFFYRNCSNYIKNGIPILDFETNAVNARSWCETFIQEFKNITGIYPMLYTSASWLSKFTGSWIPQKCGLWMAGYPQPYTSWVDQNPPYSIYPWEICAIWQFTSSLKLSGYAGNLDGNIAYMDKSAWNKYAGSSTSNNAKPATKKKSYPELVLEIYLGEWGNGSDRKRLLTQAGYDYTKAQNMVNDYINIAHQCIQGLWGNGWNRQTALESHGYNYSVVQAIVNKMIRG